MGTLTFGEALSCAGWDSVCNKPINGEGYKAALERAKKRGAVSGLEDESGIYGECEVHGRYMIAEKVKYRGAVDLRYVTGFTGCIKCHNISLSKSNIGAGMDSFGKRFAECTLKNYLIEDGGAVHIGKKEARAAAVEYTKAFIAGDKRNLMLFGMPGNGKSHIAAAIARALIERGSNAMMIKANSFINNYHGAPFDKKDDYVRTFNNVDFLVIDELDKVSKTEASMNALFALIDERDMQMLPTAIISNCTMESIKLIIGVPAFDRLNSGAVKIKFNWESNR